MIKKILKLSLALLISGTSVAQCNDLFFTEYIEGTGNNKAIEIYNPTATTIDLSGYTVFLNVNGNTTPLSSHVPSMMLAPGDVYVIANSSASAAILAIADVTASVANYNGDDAIYLVKNSTGDTLDIIGEIGIDPGNFWTVGTGSTQNYTLVRNVSVNQGTTSWATSQTQWSVFPIDMIDSLGAHTMTPCGGCTPTTFNQTITACNSYTSPSGTYTWTTSGIYNDTIFDAGGCDSMYVIDLTVNSSIVTNIQDSACVSYTSPSGNYVWTTTGIYNDTIFSTTGGCDSLFVVDLTINTGIFFNITTSSCGDYTSPSGTYTWTTSGIYNDTIFSTTGGCDSIYTVDLTINQPTFSTFAVEGCNSYLSPSGVLWVNSGTYSDTLVNAAGCDSIITFIVTLDPNSPTACAGQCSEIFFSEYIEGSSNNKALEIYNPTFTSVDLSNYVVKRHTNGAPTASGTYAMTGILAPGAVYVIGNASADPAILNVSDTTNAATFFNGDDAVSLENILTGDTLDIIGQIGIDPGTNWAVNGGATSEFTLVRSMGVQKGNTDWSTAAIEWTALPQNTFDSLGAHYMIACTTMPCVNTSSTISPSTCDSYTSPSGNNTWTVSGTYTDIIPNAAGCDSTITINLTVVDVNINVTNNDPLLTAGAVGATYQWIDCDNGNAPIAGATSQSFAPTVNGDYAVIVTVNGCADTSACETVNSVGLNQFELNHTIVVSPNPTSGAIHVNLGKAYDNVAIRILDAVGREVSAQSYKSTAAADLTIDGNAGYYFVEVSIDGVRSAVIKLVKQ